ncbi:MAG: hypothetical protein GY791_09380 [Alphaproteobacteria bacterium]|nr:hypothetical protein [Alphaproteobacteria bacterium]
MADRASARQIATELAKLYERRFGGRDRGRYRISMKYMRVLTGRKRVPGRLVRQITEELFELGFVLIDLETFFVVLGQRTFQSYRRVSEESLMHRDIAVGHV